MKVIRTRKQIFNIIQLVSNNFFFVVRITFFALHTHCQCDCSVLYKIAGRNRVPNYIMSGVVVKIFVIMRERSFGLHPVANRWAEVD